MILFCFCAFYLFSASYRNVRVIYFIFRHIHYDFIFQECLCVLWALSSMIKMCETMLETSGLLCIIANLLAGF